MTIIEAKVTDQLLTVTNDPVVASGGVKDTSVLFSFCEKWNGFIKTAVFADANKQDWYDVLLDANDKAIVPAKVMATKGRFWFGVVGVKDDIKYTAKIVQYDVAEGAAISGEEPEIPQSTIDQILAKVGAHTESTSNPHNVTKEQIGLGNVDNNITDIVNANSRQISNHEGRVSNLEGRVSNLEAGIPEEDFVEDNGVAYIKDVPVNAMPYAQINKIGGMTRKCTNLAKLTDGGAWGLNTSFGNDGKITLTTANAYGTQFARVSNVSLKANITYTFNFENPTNIECGAIWKAGTTTVVAPLFAIYQTYTPTEDIDVTIAIYLPDNSPIGTVGSCYLMVNEGVNARPYEPYFEGLRSAPVTEIESVGANLIPFPYKFSSFEENGVKFGIDAEQRITLYGTCLGSRELTFAELTLPIGSYTFSATQTSDYTRVVLTKNGTALRSQAKADNAYKFTVDSVTDIYAIVIVILSGNTYSNDIIAPMLNKGSTALPYTPYTKNTLEIPEAIRPKNGINENVYDYIDFEKKQFGKRVGCVDMGTLNWTYNRGEFDEFIASVSDIQINNAISPNMICGKYVTESWLPSMGQDKVIYKPNNTTIYVRDSAYTDTETFKDAMSGVMLYYELAEPIITDISDILPSDNLIAVEGGGTLTFKNEHEFAVPSSVVYQVESEVNV